MVANPARGYPNRRIEISLSPFTPDDLVSRDGVSRPVLRQLACSSHPGAYSRDSPRFPRRRPSVYQQPPSGQSRVYRVTQLRTSGVHRQESADIDRADSSSNGCSAYSGLPHMDRFWCAPLLFPQSLLLFLVQLTRVLYRQVVHVDRKTCQFYCIHSLTSCLEKKPERT